MTNEERFKEIYQTQITRTGAPELLAWLESTDFFTAPASTRFHGAYPGGLVDHSLNVYFALIDGPYAREFTMETARFAPCFTISAKRISTTRGRTEATP